MEIQQVLIKPLITEKSTVLQEGQKYVFVINKKANKILVKQAVEQSFGVKVIDVNICWNRGKLKRFGPKLSRSPDTKKAIVTLSPGDRIQLVEGL